MKTARIMGAVALILAVAAPAGATPPGTNGRLAFLLGASDGSYIYTIEPDGSDARRVVPADGNGETAATWDAAWSPDGTKLAFTRKVDGNQDVYVMDADGSNVVRLTQHEAADAGPAWSPNGKRLAFVSDRAGAAGAIHLMTAGGRYIRRVTRGSLVAATPDWDPRGRRIAFAGIRRHGSDGIFTIRPDGTGLKQLSSDSGRSPSWAPRGTRLAYDSGSYHEWGDDRVVVVDRDGSDAHVLSVPPGCETEECYMDHPVWSPDGRELAFVFYDRADFTSYIAVMDLHTGGVRELFYDDPGNLFEPSWQSL